MVGRGRYRAGVSASVSRLALTVLVSTALLSACGGSSDAAAPAGSVAVASVEPAPDLPSGLTPQGPTVDGVVDRVVDGDTIHVLVDGADVTVRMIGINTPETVKPDSPVECFGPQSSDFAKAVLSDQPVLLEFDDGQGRQDKYGRTLAYVWRASPSGEPVLFNLEAVAGGYAYERQYSSTAPAWKDVLRAAQDSARAAGRGLWGACPQS